VKLDWEQFTVIEVLTTFLRLYDFLKDGFRQQLKNQYHNKMLAFKFNDSHEAPCLADVGGS
jgi:uncharacterized secreted protein with C-terminal beta-propeller domain